MQEPASSIKDRIKAVMSISDAAVRFGVSRPTFYSLMVSYDEGNLTEIPESIRGFFDLVSSTDDTEQITVYLMTKSTPRDANDLKPLKIKANNAIDEYRRIQSSHDSLVSSINSCECRLDDLNHHIAEVEKESEALRSVAEISSDGSSRYHSILSDLMAKRECLLNERDMLSKQLSVSKKELDALDARLRNELSGIDSARARGDVGPWIDDGFVSTICQSGNGRALIAFCFDEEIAPSSVDVTVMIPGPGHLTVLGTYHPSPECNYVSIDDLVSGMHAYYKVTARCADGDMSTAMHPMKVRQ